jgi:hypothetical protein
MYVGVGVTGEIVIIPTVLRTRISPPIADITAPIPVRIPGNVFHKDFSPLLLLSHDTPYLSTGPAFKHECQ